MKMYEYILQKTGQLYLLPVAQQVLGRATVQLKPLGMSPYLLSDILAVIYCVLPV